jgi:hypothetical protein
VFKILILREIQYQALLPYVSPRAGTRQRVITQEYVTLCETKEISDEHTLDERTSRDESILEYKGNLLAKLVSVHTSTQLFHRMQRQSFAIIWTKP